MPQNLGGLILRTTVSKRNCRCFGHVNQMSVEVMTQKLQKCRNIISKIFLYGYNLPVEDTLTLGIIN